jgi:hypothetical protein
MEEGILKLWEGMDAFQTSLKFSEGRKEFNFYDGPPFATGTPHYGHLLAGTIKVQHGVLVLSTMIHGVAMCRMLSPGTPIKLGTMFLDVLAGTPMVSQWSLKSTRSSTSVFYQSLSVSVRPSA